MAVEGEPHRRRQPYPRPAPSAPPPILAAITKALRGDPPIGGVRPAGRHVRWIEDRPRPRRRPDGATYAARTGYQRRPATAPRVGGADASAHAPRGHPRAGRGRLAGRGDAAGAGGD